MKEFSYVNPMNGKTEVTRSINIDSLFIEVTRKCNMHCDHCLRGDAECIDIQNKYIERALEGVSAIYELTFTGGEPSLNIPAILYTLEICKKNNINVDNFYIVTNGKENVKELVLACIEWYAYTLKCGCGEYSGIALSQDQFHDSIPKENIYLLQALSFFHPNDKKTQFTYDMILAEGRGASIGSRINPHYELEYTRNVIDQIDVNGSMVYISANGEVKDDCNISYENHSRTIGNLTDTTLFEIVAKAEMEKVMKDFEEEEKEREMECIYYTNA